MLFNTIEMFKNPFFKSDSGEQTIKNTNAVKKPRPDSLKDGVKNQPKVRVFFSKRSDDNLLCMIVEYTGPAKSLETLTDIFVIFSVSIKRLVLIVLYSIHSIFI